MGDLKERARAWYERAFYSDDTRSQCIDSLTTLLAEVRSERLPCGHLAGELQGEDGGMRWCAGCEREAGIRAEVVEAALSGIRETIDECEDEDYVAWDTLESVLIERIRALDSADYVAARREDFEVIADAAEEALAHYYAPLEELETYKVRADEIRAALSRARKGD